MRRLLTLLTAVVIVVNLAMGQTREDWTADAIENLKTGIVSDNNGLQRSSIYFAGFYQISETVDVLCKEMLNNADPNTQILAALALYRIGDDSVTDDLIELIANQNEEVKVRKMAKAIYDQWFNKSEKFAVTSH